MTRQRRSRGDGGLHWNDARGRWIATVTTGYNARGKRVTRKASGRTKTEAKNKLKEILRDLDDGVSVASDGYTVADAVNYWLTYGTSSKSDTTVANYTFMATNHIIPPLGKRKLRELSAEHIDRWLTVKSPELSTRSLRLIHSILNRAVKHAQARDKVKRNVVTLCDIPTGRTGRPSKSLTLAQAEAVLVAAEGSPMHAYVVLSLLLGARTEELRGLRWDHVVTYDQQRQEWQPVTEAGWNGERFAVYLWRSVRTSGEMKNRTSRRTLALPTRCVNALRTHHEHRSSPEYDLVFATKRGTRPNAGNVRRDFRRVIEAAGLTAEDWTPREMRHSFVSLLSDNGVPLEDIARMVGHRTTAVTETVYRKQIRPIITEGATVMDRIFGTGHEGTEGQGESV